MSRNQVAMSRNQVAMSRDRKSRSSRDRDSEKPESGPIATKLRSIATLSRSAPIPDRYRDSSRLAIGTYRDSSRLANLRSRDHEPAGSRSRLPDRLGFTATGNVPRSTNGTSQSRRSRSRSGPRLHCRPGRPAGSRGTSPRICFVLMWPKAVGSRPARLFIEKVTACLEPRLQTPPQIHVHQRFIPAGTMGQVPREEVRLRQASDIFQGDTQEVCPGGGEPSRGQGLQ